MRYLAIGDSYTIGEALQVEDSWSMQWAHALRAKGIPFVLASGGHVEPPPAEFADTPMIEKPYTIDRVSPIIDAVLDATSSA